MNYREEKKLRREREDLIRRYHAEMKMVNTPIQTRIHQINCALTASNYQYIPRRA